MDKPTHQELLRPSTETDADHGDAEAQFGLGLKFASNTAEAQDYAQAAHWYRKAADQNHALAQFNLGVMYTRGQGVVRNDTMAGMWIGKAAQQGDAGAQYHLGMRHHRASLGSLPEAALESRLEAYKWLHLAAAQGYRGSDAACEFTALAMTREEVKDAKLRMVAFIAESTRSAGSIPPLGAVAAAGPNKAE